MDDCADAIRRVCEIGKIGEIYNIGTEFEITNYDVTMLIHQTVNELLKRLPFYIIKLLSVYV